MDNVLSKVSPICAAFALATLIGASPALAAEAAPAPDLPPALAPLTALYQTAACDPDGPTGADGTLATQLNSRLNADMRGYMSAYRVSCAREVVEAVRDRGLSSRAAVIAITTVIVETHLQNISEEVDHTSLGLFQQQEWWGTRAQRLNPDYATNAFLDAMVRKYPSGSWASAPIGEVCQAVQVSAYPDRYQAQASDAQIIVDSLWNVPAPRLEDIPVSGDWNGDGTDTVGVYRPSNSTFYLRDTNSGDATRVFKFGHGPSGDIPVAGDWNNDGKDTVGVFRPGNSTWYLTNGTTTTDAQFIFGHGGSGDIPVAGDWNNDGYDSVGVFRPGNSTWYLTNGTTTATNNTDYEFKFGHGPSGDQPVAGDWNNDGTDTPGVFRPSNSTWYLTNGTTTTDHQFIYGHGGSGDIPVTGDWNNDNTDTPGVRRPDNNTVYLRNTNSAGPVDIQFIYGI
ncbi:VCBS repeat-containing protein [Micromonospora sp. WMMD975]|uniref:FG-GAP repeat domain-containing protein n=1 Tax=Micromonospora sp. WMMD975 TaxID=3016087 RepID=UPI00249A5491|nr:VCBS repeat-containing protein [Micromonospora sp. WMMD975]WFE35295.1 VCBS repeat-containing protein [Micromonospora sp. WMMD975]